MPDRRLKAVWDVRVPVIRELAGVHEYDGVVMDLSPGGRKAALGRLGCASPGERLADRHDESHLTAAEQAAHAEAEAGLLRWNPLPHIQTGTFPAMTASTPQGAGGTPRPVARGS